MNKELKVSYWHKKINFLLVHNRFCDIQSGDALFQPMHNDNYNDFVISQNQIADFIRNDKTH